MNTESYGDALDGALKEIARLHEVNQGLMQAAKQVLEALERSPYMSNKDDHDFHQQAITALQNALPKE